MLSITVNAKGYSVDVPPNTPLLWVLRDHLGLTGTKTIVALVVAAVMSLAGSFLAPCHAQDTAKDEKPTFYRLTPGVYVNGWPRFTVSYPRDWVEQRPQRDWVFRAGAPGLVPFPAFAVAVVSSPFPLAKFSELSVPFLSTTAENVTVVSDKLSQLRGGIQARELELQMVMNGTPLTMLCVAMKRGDVWIVTGVMSSRGKIGEDLKAIPYSLEFQQGYDEPVKVPLDVQKFLDKYVSDLVFHDDAKVWADYSDRFLHSGMRKREWEQTGRMSVGYWITSAVRITDFVPEGDRAYLAGSVNSVIGKAMLLETSIIKENGDWKWYGNQRDIIP